MAKRSENTYQSGLKRDNYNSKISFCNDNCSRAFDDGWSTKASIALKLYTALKNEGIQAPLPVRRIISEDNIE